MNVTTIVAPNYLPYARVLATSFLDQNPNAKVSVLVVDDPESRFSAPNEPFEVLSPLDIGLSGADFHRMALMYTMVELATAVKPWLLRQLLKRDGGPIAYLDPDIQVFSPIDEIHELAVEHGVVLTPHMTEPMPKDDFKPTELDILQAGVYNLGFIAVGPGGERFLDWWADRLRTHSIKAPERGLMVDQRWVDLVPGYFGAYVLRDPSYNVAYWNLPTRRLEVSKDDKYKVDGRPLRFFHFSGFNPYLPHLLSKFQIGIPRIDLAEYPAVAQICHQYADLLMKQGFAESSTRPYLFDFLPDGRPVTHRMRRIYRTAILEAERTGGPLPPDPYSLSSRGQYARWYRSFTRTRPAMQRLTTAVLARGSRLAEGYPALYDFGRQVLHGTRRIRHNLQLRKSSAKVRQPTMKAGLNVVGYFRAESGVGEAGRLLLAASRDSGIPYTAVSYANTPNRQNHPFREEGSAWTAYDTNIICVNADALPTFARDAEPDFFKGRYSVGLWMWEVEDFPQTMHKAFSYVNEVWVASQFVADAVSAVSRKPVNIFPLPVIPPRYDPQNIPEFARSQRFKFLFVFDFLSVFERKNPIAVVDAYKLAFPDDREAVLIIKSISGDQRRAHLMRLQEAAEGRQDIRVFDGYVSREEKSSLIGSCDCYVSLHRSEGFGLTLAEAMVLGKAVIGTAYSGPLDFMNQENSFLVPHEFSRIPAGCGPYPEGGRWAEPDLAEAARLMRFVYENRGEAKRKGEAARSYILETRSVSVGSDFLQVRLNSIWSSKS